MYNETIYDTSTGVKSISVPFELFQFRRYIQMTFFFLCRWFCSSAALLLIMICLADYGLISLEYHEQC